MVLLYRAACRKRWTVCLRTGCPCHGHHRPPCASGDGCEVEHEVLRPACGLQPVVGKMQAKGLSRHGMNRQERLPYDGAQQIYSHVE